MPLPTEHDVERAERRLAAATAVWDGYKRRVVSDDGLRAAEERAAAVRREAERIGPVMPVRDRLRVAALAYSSGVSRLFGLSGPEVRLAAPFGGLVGAAAVAVLAAVVRPPAWAVVVACLAAFSVGTGFAWLVIHSTERGLVAEIERVRADADDRGRRLAALAPEREAADEHLHRLRAAVAAEREFAAATAEAERVRAVARLAGDDWFALKGPALVGFFAGVFRAHGHRVEMLAGNRFDLDLVVQTASRRYGVQVIGWADSVSTSAFARLARGVAAGGLDAGVLVTKGTLTGPAREAAGRDGLLVFDRERVPDLVADGLP